MTLSRTRLPAWYLHSLTSSGRTDSNAHIAFIVRRDFLQLTKLGVLVRRRCDGWGGVRRRRHQRVGRGRVGYTTLLASGPSSRLGNVPLRRGDGGPRCLGRSDTSLGHHIVSRIKVFTVLPISLEHAFLSLWIGRTFCIFVRRFFPGTLPYILNAFWSCSLIDYRSAPGLGGGKGDIH
jgi:hypothetical protein